MNIHTIGDSHSKYGWNKIDDVMVHHIGPKLCYSIGRDKPIMVHGSLPLESDGYSVPPWKQIVKDDMVIFCFGEIDCRCHIGKYVITSGSSHISGSVSSSTQFVEKTHKDVIDEIVEPYFEALKLNEQAMSGIKIVVYNVPPPCKQYEQHPMETFPFVGTDDERKTYHEYFNSALSKKCKEYGYAFFNVYDRYKDDEGFIEKNFSDGGVHITDPIYMKDELERVKKFFGGIA